MLFYNFDKFNYFIRIKTCIAILSFYIYITAMIFKIAECLFKLVIIFIVCKIWNAWNLSLSPAFELLLNKSYSVEIISFSFIRFIFSFLKNLFENSGTTVLQNNRLSVTFLISRLLKYVPLVFLNSFIQKLCCDVYPFQSEKVFDFKNYFLVWIFS